MDADEVREFLLKLPHVEETMQWGANLVFWVGDKAIGGKMFALANLEEDGKAVLSFHAGPKRFAELLEIEGVIPAPYMARIHWVALERWDVLRRRELQELLLLAREMVYEKLPRRTKDVLAMPPAARKKMIAERKKIMASGTVKKEKATRPE
ncbi:MAG: MmcQ/YjbR family DNA-binding protein [Acidobacteriaceae bacterium]